MADFTVLSRNVLRPLWRGEEGRCFNSSAESAGLRCDAEAVDCNETTEVECDCRKATRFPWDCDRSEATARLRLDMELAAEGVPMPAAELRRSFLGSLSLAARLRLLFCRRSTSSSSSCPTHQSHTSHPINVAKLLQPTTETGDTRSWKMPTKKVTNIVTEHTCWSITVESATRGQNS